MERLKDILYDLSDILITVSIVAIIFLVVTWKLNDAIPASETLLNPTTSASESVSSSLITNTTEAISEQNAGTPRDLAEPQNEVSTITTNLSESETETLETKTTQSETLESTQININNSDISQFVVPYGTTSLAIASDLTKNGLISNDDEFITRLVERDDERNLKSGSFDLSKAETLDDIIDILINK